MVDWVLAEDVGIVSGSMHFNPQRQVNTRPAQTADNGDFEV